MESLDEIYTVPFDRLEVMVQANKQNIQSGEDYHAQISIPSITTSEQMDMKVNGKSIPVKNGIGLVEFKADKPGDYQWEGEITIKYGENKDSTFKIIQNYTVIPKK